MKLFLVSCYCDAYFCNHCSNVYFSIVNLQFVDCYRRLLLARCPQSVQYSHTVHCYSVLCQYDVIYDSNSMSMMLLILKLDVLVSGHIFHLTARVTSMFW